MNALFVVCLCGSCGFEYEADSLESNPGLCDECIDSSTDFVFYGGRLCNELTSQDSPDDAIRDWDVSLDGGL